jgi:aryl-alcohol dehydrogenase-like predicted oxidoreductase
MIRHLGLSGVGAVELSEALSIAPVVCVQNRFGIESPRSDDAFIAECSSRGVAFVPFFSLAGDARQRGMERVPDQVEVLARARGVSAAQVLLAWSLQQGGHVLVIPGTGNPDHVVENVAAGSLRLTREELEMLDELRS